MGEGRRQRAARRPRQDATTGRTFTQRVDGIGGGQYPSIPVVPAAGCWTLTETVGNRTAGAVTIAVEKAI